MRYTHYIFDLDGTLIDSFEDIFQALEGAARQVGMERPSRAQVRALMQYKLDEMITRLYPHDGAKHDALASGFKERYDESGFRSSILYPGVEETLGWLQERKRHLYITTNKRHVATMALLRKFSLHARFDAIITPDQGPGARLTKVDMLRILRREHGLSSGETVFIGDTMGDCLAARDCEFDFIMVTYGYGTLDRNDLVSRRVRTIDTISALSDDDL